MSKKTAATRSSSRHAAAATEPRTPPATAQTGPVRTDVPPAPANPPLQPAMIPATQIPGAVVDAYDSSEGTTERKPHTNPVRVRAKKMAYVGDRLQRVGDVFDIPGDRFEEDVMSPNDSKRLIHRKGDLVHFSKNTMELVKADTPAHTTGSNADLKRGVPTGDDVLGDE